MIFRGRKLSEITRQDLQRLRDDQVQEGDTLEYKSTMYGNSDDDKREMLKDISSMANHRGGYLIIGMEGDEEGIATKVVGIEADNHAERITSSYLANIDKRIVGLDMKDVQLADDRIAIVVSIPESMNAPHMITFKGLNQFWKRHGRQKAKMTVDEIGEAFEKRLSNLNRLDRFLVTRKAEILEEIGGYTYMQISASPAYLREEVLFDIHDEQLKALITHPPVLQQGSERLYHGHPYPTFHGLRVEDWSPYSSQPRGHYDYLEVFHNGYIEYGNLIAQPRAHDISFHVVSKAALIVILVMLIEKVYGAYLPLMPVIVNFAIYNARGIWLQGGHLENTNQVKWPKQHLELEKFYIEDLNTEAKLLPKRINDRIWQAFHLERATVFDGEGKLLSR